MADYQAKISKWSDCMDCHASTTPPMEYCPECGSERMKQEEPNEVDLFIEQERNAEARLMGTAILGGGR